MKFHFEDTSPLSLPIYKRCDNIIYENKFNIHAAKFFSTDLPSVILSIETISFFDLLFGKFQCLSIWNEWSNLPRRLIFRFDGVVKACNHSEKEKCCSFVPLWGFLSVYELMTFLYLSKKIMQIHLVANIFLFSWIKISYSIGLTTSNCSKLSKSVFPFPWIRKYLSFL